MKNNEETMKWLMKHRYDSKTNTIKLNGLGDWKINIDCSRIIGKNIDNKSQHAIWKIFNSVQKASEISNVGQEAENYLSNFAQECIDGKIDNTHQNAKTNILNSSQKVLEYNK